MSIAFAPENFQCRKYFIIPNDSNMDRGGHFSAVSDKDYDRAVRNILSLEQPSH